MCGHRKGGRDRQRNVASRLHRYVRPLLGHRSISQKHDCSSKEKCSCQAPYAAHLHAVASKPLGAWGGRKYVSPKLGRREVCAGSPRAPLSVGRRQKWGWGCRSSKRSRSRALCTKKGSTADFRGPLLDTFCTGGLWKGGEGATARRPVPAFPVLSGAVFGSRNGSCCFSAETELWEPLPPRQAPPPLSDASAPRRVAPPRPRPRLAPGARSKLSDILGSGWLRRSWERASDSISLRRSPSTSLSVSPPHTPPRWSRPRPAHSAPSRPLNTRRHSNLGGTEA